MLSKVASSSIFLVFVMTRPGIEPRSPGPLVNTLLIRRMAQFENKLSKFLGVTSLQLKPDAVATVMEIKDCLIQYGYN